MPFNFSVLSYGRTLPAAALDEVRSAVSGTGARLVEEQLEQGPQFAVHTIGVQLDADRAGSAKGALSALRAVLAETAQRRAATHGDLSEKVDTAVVPALLRSARRKLIVLDVDSTLIQQEVIELLAAHAGVAAEVAEVTEAAMRGELDFAQSLHARVATLAGLPESVLAEVVGQVRLTEGADRLVGEARAAGHVVAAVSGGFSRILAPLAADLGLDHALANDLEIVDGVLTGRVSGAVVDRAAKAAALRRWCAEDDISLDHTMAIGDGANDLDMMAIAGLSVAFNAKPAVREAADAQINLPYLDIALPLAGI
ncbi:phosphoserine phosphatase SerB [Paenarthrobacter sp. Z7-10]|uniref:phosphoserine phosphatase SerB n=1 Tax=Paenarthrobacter sp. Z7-10 TaxID=2787635 RepID=UPI0022A97D67|nr:phosphoserine phosphatase SerB [Paenarthrobacter sp. Z7-10]MCZ2402641.1 phosphoserine phosphatase SerB [Paenarthrobacter sp. Z7-10]